ncbi:MAG: transglycosylase domain-containing protein, partial [Candidatus Sungbacteria bacterium]|nr:transglycosylase domain-containing protein [Candidatus Sungbacteria bacterium]
MPAKKRKRRSGITFFLTLVFVAGLSAGGIWLIYTVKNLPSPEYLFSRKIVESTKIFDSSGSVLLYEIHGEEKRTVIPAEEMPNAVKNAAVAIEDANFYRHRGVDLRGILRALVKDLVSRDLRQGGSTITQQLIKNSLLTRERTVARKVREALLAIALESRLDKEKILELYLNQIPYGQNAYGIEAAAQTFFGRHARDLSIAEAALLAALPRAPSYYSPYGQHKDELLKRKDLIIEREYGLGYISATEAEKAKKEALKFLPAAKNIRAPHFVMYVRDYLVSRYGEDEIDKESAEKNERLVKARNMALVGVNPKNGDILAMVGSRDYFDIERDGNFNVATALRQPGSAFKPFVYATAFGKGFIPDTVLFDIFTEFNPNCTPEGLPRPGTNLNPKDCYHPQDYDERFRGPVTLRQALGSSLNVPSVKLLYLAGIEDSIRTAEAMGISSLGARERFGLSLVLGGAEVK